MSNHGQAFGVGCKLMLGSLVLAGICMTRSLDAQSSPASASSPASTSPKSAASSQSADEIRHLLLRARALKASSTAPREAWDKLTARYIVPLTGGNWEFIISDTGAVKASRLGGNVTSEFRLSTADLKELARCLTATAWLAAPRANVLHGTDLPRVEISVTINGTTRTERLYADEPRPYDVLHDFFWLLRDQEELASKGPGTVVYELYNHIRRERGEKVTVSYWPSDYRRFIPMVKQIIDAPSTHSADEIKKAKAVLEFIKAQYEEETPASAPATGSATKPSAATPAPTKTPGPNRTPGPPRKTR